MDTETAPSPRCAPRRRHLQIVPPDAVARVLAVMPHIRQLMVDACEWSDGRYEPQDVLNACAGEDPHWTPQLWITGHSGGGAAPTLDAIAVTELAAYRTGLKALHVILVAGREAKAWLEFEGEFETWAAREGCSKLQMIGRRGWARTLPHWTLRAYMLERDITPMPATPTGEGLGDE